ncbi:MAG: hypothetical protein IKQ35_00180 [Bacilli bacterium]|nr:hypothetical protein [Bacilli bacterium]
MNDLLKKEYIIVEVIPTAVKNGDIAQLSALRLRGLELIDRFDYRNNNIDNPFVLDLIKYDKDSFIYKDSTDEIVKDFKKFIGKKTILYLDNIYTLNYLEKFNNKKVPVLKYLDLSYSDEVIDEIKNKYNILDSNYIVDILYEALIYESNKK